MSSDEAEHTPVPAGWKKRRLQGACDACRRKKIKCDSANKNGRQCTNCASFGMECTHSEPVKKRGPKSTYVEGLEKRVKEMEEVLRKYNIQTEDLNENQQSPSHSAGTAGASSRPSPPSYSGVPSSISSNPGYPSLSADSPSTDSQSQDQEEEEEDFAHVALADHLSKLSLSNVQRRFFGPSSAFMIMRSAHQVKEQTLGHETQPFKRPQYWGIQAWEKQFSDREIPVYSFPKGDLMLSLISLYFSEVNVFLPIIHAPSFKQCVSEGLQHRDPYFAATLLLVCAVASRYSNDPRVFADHSSELSCGWNFFEQVQMMRKSLFDPPTLFELQFYSLATLFMLGTSSPSSAWTLVAVGIRFAEEMGVHRKAPAGHKWTSLDEQQRRAFWVLVSLDRLTSSFFGRPTAIRDEDFDVEPPIECDDEYWEEVSFQQPPDQPSRMSCFNSHLRLVEILAFGLRTLYSSRRSKMLLGLVGEEWDQKILREIDTALNRWFTSVPEHLRWNPMQQNPIFFRQSVFLYTMYYNVQIQSHRPFLSKASQASFHSLAIATNAARSTVHILDASIPHGIIGLPHIIYGAYISAIVIMLNVWGSKRAGIKLDHRREIENASKVMEILRASDQRWNIAGRLWDMLSELVRDFNVLDHYQPSNKRARNSNDPISTLTPLSTHPVQTSSSYQAPQSQSYSADHNSKTSAEHLASQLMSGWKMSPENAPSWTNQQTMESLSSIDKKTMSYLEQIFGRIDNFPHDASATYPNVYPESNQNYTQYPSQLQPGYEGEGFDTRQPTGFWTSSGFVFDAWNYVESMGLSTPSSYQ